MGQTKGNTRGATLVELLVSISIITVLATITMPAIMAARDRANGLECMSNMRQLGLAMQDYVEDHDSQYPADRYPLVPYFMEPQRERWSDNFLYDLASYTGRTSVFLCPSAVTPHPLWWAQPTALSNTSYWGNAVVMGRTAQSIPSPSQIVVMQEGMYRMNMAGERPAMDIWDCGYDTPYALWHNSAWSEQGRQEYSSVHNGGGNLLYCDSHVEFRAGGSLHSGDFGLLPANDGIHAPTGRCYATAF